MAKVATPPSKRSGGRSRRAAPAPEPEQRFGADGAPEQPRARRSKPLQRAATFHDWSLPRGLAGESVRIPRGEGESMSPRRVTVRRFDRNELSWTDRRVDVDAAMKRAMKRAPADLPCRMGGSADWALSTTRHGNTAPTSEYALPPIRSPGETWASYFARVPDAVAPGTETLLSAERRRVGKNLSDDLREASCGAAEVLGRQAELTAVRHNADTALKRACLRFDADLAKEALLQGANPNVRVKLGRRTREDQRTEDELQGSQSWETHDSLHAIMREGAAAATAALQKPNRVPVLHLCARRCGTVRSFTDGQLSAARGKTHRVHYDIGWSATFVDDVERWCAVNLLQPTERHWARSEAEAKRIAKEEEEKRLWNQPARPAHYKESMDESLALPIIRMLLGLKGNVDEDNRPVEHKNAWRDEDGNWKADVDAIDVNGNTALHEAARRNAPRVVELLLGAFPSESVDLKI